MERLTNQQAKEAAVREAYGAQYEKAKNYICADGSIPEHIAVFLECPKSEWHYHHNNVRPNALKGLEDNKGWCRIQQDGSNLPTKEGLYEIGYFKNGEFIRSSDANWTLIQTVHALTKNGYTHYRPKEVTPKPIY